MTPAKMKKVLGDVLKIFIFCVTFVHLSLSDSYFSLYLFLLFRTYFLCSPVFVDMYTTKQVFCSSCSVATVFFNFIFI